MNAGWYYLAGVIVGIGIGIWWNEKERAEKLRQYADDERMHRLEGMVRRLVAKENGFHPAVEMPSVEEVPA